MLQNNGNEAFQVTGIPYDNISWDDIMGQPFGTASNFNAIVFGNANNIVDTKGAMAVEGDFVSPRGLTLGFGNNGKLEGTGYSPNLVRFLVGRNVAMQGPLVVAGHVVAGGNFRAAKGSTYMIGKDGTNDQAQTLTRLYQASNGSRYWRVSDHGNHYVISSYDVPRYIPARRINADITGFFQAAKESITKYHHCIVNLQPNGTVTEHYHEWILRGNDPKQNIFLVDARPNGILNKEIRFEIPEGSLGIVILRTGPHAHLQYGLWGREAMANRTLYVFEDAQHIHMEVPAAIWGSILAPEAMFHAHQTGGTVSGNAALGGFAVNASSGFEFHLYPFVGGVVCSAVAPEVQPAPQPVQQPVMQPTPPTPPPVQQPVEQPMPQPTPQPAQRPVEQLTPPPAPRPVQQPVEQPTPPPAPRPVQRPVEQPTPPPTPRPVQRPVEQPTPPPTPRPVQRPVEQPTPPPTPRPVQRPVEQPVQQAPKPAPPQSPRRKVQPPVVCPECPPCPVCEEAPVCPACPEAVTNIVLEPVPIPIPIPYEKNACQSSCMVEPGVIFGCIWGCNCCRNHEWEVTLYKGCGDVKVQVGCTKISCCGCFEFKVPYDDYYLLIICPVGRGASSSCKPMLTLKNVGVVSLMIG